MSSFYCALNNSMKPLTEVNKSEILFCITSISDTVVFVQYNTVILFEQCLGVAKTAGKLCSRLSDVFIMT